MSDPVVQINWTKVRPFIVAYLNVCLGELFGFVMVSLSEGVPLFAGWAEIGLALMGGLVLEIVLEYNDPPPTKKNAGRRRFTRIVAGIAYGLGAINIIGIFERIAGGLLG